MSANPCPACRFTTDGNGGIVFVGCVRCEAPEVDIAPENWLTPKSILHGNPIRYTMYGCRCVACTGAWNRKTPKVATA